MTEELGIPPRVQRIVAAWRADQISIDTARELFREAMLEDRRTDQIEAQAGIPAAQEKQA